MSFWNEVLKHVVPLYGGISEGKKEYDMIFGNRTGSTPAAPAQTTAQKAAAARAAYMGTGTDVSRSANVLGTSYGVTASGKPISTVTGPTSVVARATGAGSSGAASSLKSGSGITAAGLAGFIRDVNTKNVPVAPGYPAYTSDQTYAKAVAAARSGLAADLAGLDGLRKQRIAEIQARVSTTATSAEKKRLSDQIAGINSDADRAAKSISLNYGQAVTEATNQYGALSKLAANASNDVKQFYNGAQARVTASNASALGDAAANYGGAGMGLGNTVVGGEAALAPKAISNEGFVNAANAETDAVLVRDDVGWLKNSLAGEKAAQAGLVATTASNNANEARSLSASQVAERVRQDQAAAYSAIDAINNGFDNRRYSLQDADRSLLLGGAERESNAKDAYTNNAQQYSIAQQLADYQDQKDAYKLKMAGYAAKDAMSGINRSLTGSLANVPNIQETPADVLLAGTSANPTTEIASYKANLTGILAETDPVAKRNAAIAYFGALSDTQKATLLKYGYDTTKLLTLAGLG